MIIKCPNCGGALVYDTKAKKVRCGYCQSVFEVNQIDQKVEKMDKMTRQEIIDSGIDDDSYMGLNVYSCTSCGGQIRVNGVETSTFCSFCGQPTIIFDRVEKSKKPDYILPFSFPKEKVEDAVRQKLNSGFFVPPEMKNFKTECIRGIYVPFWLLDVNYNASVIVRGSHNSGKTRIVSYYYRKGNAVFKKITLDASKQLADESSQRLEPYDLKSLKPFNVNYLTGFYADGMDIAGDPIDEIAKKRTQELFNEQIMKTVKDSDLSIHRENKQVDVVGRHYAMLPVWFLSFHNQGTPHTYLVNGQTGKVIGAVDFSRKKSYPLMAALAIALSIVASFVIYIFFMVCDDGEDAFKFAAFLLIISVAIAGAGYGFQNAVKENMELTQSEKMFNLVRKRQEDH